MACARVIPGLHVWTLGVALLLCAAACGDDETHPSGPSPLFPEDYASSYVEVRNCRPSGDHDLNIIRVLADPAALDPYVNRDQPIPEGAVLLKEEYDFGETDCNAPIKQWTVMVRLAQGSSPDTLDWRWQRVDSGRQVVEQDAPRCAACHAACNAQSGGYENTCTVP